MTQKRLVHRAGVLAAILITALIGLSLLAGLLYYYAEPGTFPASSPQDAGKMFYGWLIGVEALVLVAGGFNRISRVLAEDRRAGLWDSNRLTPLRPSQLAIGYWFGAALREFYMSAVLALLGFVIVVSAGLPLSFWLETQLLLAGTALFFGLLALLIGTAFPGSQFATLLFLAFLLAQLPSFMAPRYFVTSHLLPTYAMIHLFSLDESWRDSPQFFGCPLPPVLYSLGLQFVVGLFFWRAVQRKTANPFQPVLQRWEALALFTVVIVAQHGLIWELWRGRFGAVFPIGEKRQLLSMVHAETLLMGAVVLVLAGAQPGRIRIEVLRSGFPDLWRVISRSSVAFALALTGVAGIVLLTQFTYTLPSAWPAYLAAVGNLLAFFTSFTLLREFCQLRFGRRSMGFLFLGLFVLCLLPFILAGVFSSPSLSRLSLLSPGIVALDEAPGRESTPLLFTVAGQLLLALMIFLLWLDRWRKLLQPNSLPRPAAS